jgi:hypothetical protein
MLLSRGHACDPPRSSRAPRLSAGSITAGIFDQRNGVQYSICTAKNLQLPMSALGQKRTLRLVYSMSALPLKADIGTQSWNVRFVPFPDILRSNEKTLFEHFIDTGEPAHSI